MMGIAGELAQILSKVTGLYGMVMTIGIFQGISTLFLAGIWFNTRKKPQ